MRKGHLKLHATVDARAKQVVSMEATTGDVEDGSIMSRSCRERGTRACGQAPGRWCVRLEGELRLPCGEMEPVIRVRRNSVPRGRGCYARRTVEEFLSPGRAGWSRAHGYGMRWAVEGCPRP